MRFADGGSRSGHASQQACCRLSSIFSPPHRPMNTPSVARFSNGAPSPSRKENTQPPFAHPQTIILMKNLRLAFLLLLTALPIPVTASDIQSRGTTMTGIVTSIDHSTRSVTFEQSHGKEIRRFVYARRANFWHGDADASPGALRAGMHVQIDLRNPVFGPDFVTQIVLLDSAPSAVEKANK